MIPIISLIFGFQSISVDTVWFFKKINPSDIAVVEGQIAVSTVDGYIYLRSGESWLPPFNGFLSWIDSDGIYLYLLFSDGIRVFTANGRFTGKTFPGMYSDFCISIGGTVFALQNSGKTIVRWDYRGRKYIDISRRFTPIKIIGTGDGFGLVFPQKTVIFDENGFTVDSIGKPADWVYFKKNNGVIGYIFSDTLRIENDYTVLDSVISVFQTGDAVYILQSDGTVLRAHLPGTEKK